MGLARDHLGKFIDLVVLWKNNNPWTAEITATPVWIVREYLELWKSTLFEEVGGAMIVVERQNGMVPLKVKVITSPDVKTYGPELPFFYAKWSEESPYRVRVPVKESLRLEISVNP